MTDKNLKDDKKVEVEETQLEDVIESAKEIDYEDKYRRALADYQNLLKQANKEKIDIIKYANENLLFNLLPVYSNLKIAIAHANENSDAWLEGVKFVTKQFKDVLLSAGVEEIEITGQLFDHNTMEALSEEETDDKDKNGLVVKEATAGYKLNGRVVMPAKVVVYKFKDK
ncbi:MAG: nucleotide exchange factor GrpE [Patescibacteria group bacterium]|nr:nucleotide exchange factor GrpE [Patescibacteria group bacterium]